MISVGGKVIIADEYENRNDLPYVSSVDPWEQGIGVFDLVEMAWKAGYDPAAGPYTTPQMVKDYYAVNATYPSSVMSDETLRSWFVPNGESTCSRLNILDTGFDQSLLTFAYIEFR